MSEPDDILVPGEEFTAEEIALLEQLGEEALNDARPTLSFEEVGARLEALHLRTVREQKRLA